MLNGKCYQKFHYFLGTFPLVEKFYSRNFVVVKRKGKQASALSSSIARGGHIQSLQTLIVNSLVVHIFCEQNKRNSWKCHPISFPIEDP